MNESAVLTIIVFSVLALVASYLWGLNRGYEICQRDNQKASYQPDSADFKRGV